MRRLLVILALLIVLPGSSARAQFSGGGGGPAQAAPLSAAELQSNCQGGNPVSCDDLGMRYLKGDGVAKNARKSAELFQRACDGGDAVGCFDLGESYRIGEGVKSDKNAAAAQYQRACDGKHATACAELALIYLSDNKQGAGMAKAAIYADRGCKANRQLGCALLGIVYAQGTADYPKDLSQAERYLNGACFADLDPNTPPTRAAIVACPALEAVTEKSACIGLGSTDGSMQDVCFEAPAAWSKRAIPRGAYQAPARAAPALAADPAAIGNNALSTANAAYARKDFATAATQYAVGCDAGNATACGKLGEMFVRGEGVKANSARAAGPLAKACDGGVAAACGELASLYAVGDGVGSNTKLAHTLFAKACQGGIPLACKSQSNFEIVNDASSSSNTNAASFASTSTNNRNKEGYSKFVLAENFHNQAKNLILQNPDYKHQQIGYQIRDLQSKANAGYSDACTLGYFSACVIYADRLEEHHPMRDYFLSIGCRGGYLPACRTPALQDEYKRAQAARLAELKYQAFRKPPSKEEERLTALCESSKWDYCAPRAKLMSTRLLSNCDSGDLGSCSEYNYKVMYDNLPQTKPIWRTARALVTMNKYCATWKADAGSYQSYCGASVLIKERLTEISDESSSDPAARKCIVSSPYTKIQRRTYRQLDPNGPPDLNSDGTPVLYEEDSVSYNIRQSFDYAWNSPGLDNKCSRDISFEVRYQTEGLPREKFTIKAHEENLHTTYRNPIVINARFAK